MAFKIPDPEIQDKNVANFEKGTDKFICTQCGRETHIDGSYSSRGYNLTCCDCAEKICEEEGMMFSSEVCRKYIWR